MINKAVILAYIHFFWQGTNTRRVRRIVERHFRHNAEHITMCGSWYKHSTGGGWYHAE